MGFSRQEYWSGLPFPSPGDLPNPGIEPGSPACRQMLYYLSHQGSTLFMYIYLKTELFILNHHYYFSIPEVWCPAGFLIWLTQLVSDVAEWKASYHLLTYCVYKILCIVKFNSFGPKEECGKLHGVVWLQSLWSSLHHITSRIPLWSLSGPLVEQRKQEWFLRKWYNFKIVSIDAVLS